MNKAGENWRDLTDLLKEPYLQQARDDHQRYEKQLKDFNEKGFFYYEDGMKSTEMEIGKRKSRHCEKNEVKAPADKKRRGHAKPAT